MGSSARIAGGLVDEDIAREGVLTGALPEPRCCRPEVSSDGEANPTSRLVSGAVAGPVVAGAVVAVRQVTLGLAERRHLRGGRRELPVLELCGDCGLAATGVSRLAVGLDDDRDLVLHLVGREPIDLVGIGAQP